MAFVNLGRGRPDSPVGACYGAVMAGQISHILAGEEALGRALPAVAPTILESSGASFRLGCQGPDIFYHNQRTMPSGLHYGALAHRRGYGSLVVSALLSLPPELRKPLAPAGAYILGMATHAALDRYTHPYIVYRSGWRDPAVPESERYRSCHPFLERLLDLVILAELRGLGPAGYSVSALLCPTDPSPSDEADIVALWSAGLRAAFPRSTSGDLLLERRIANALSDARHFYALTDPARPSSEKEKSAWIEYLRIKAGARGMALIYPDPLPEGQDFGNARHLRWEHPAGDGRAYDSSYGDLFEEGCEKAAAAVSVIAKAMDLEDIDLEAIGAMARTIGDGGLSVTDAQGLALGPRISDPLPLAEIMEAEYRRRLERSGRYEEKLGRDGGSSIDPQTPLG
jgi:hypothetical protein